MTIDNAGVSFRRPLLVPARVPIIPQMLHVPDILMFHETFMNDHPSFHADLMFPGTNFCVFSQKPLSLVERTKDAAATSAGSICTDISPDEDYSCTEQASWGKVGPWSVCLTEAGYIVDAWPSPDRESVRLLQLDAVARDDAGGSNYWNIDFNFPGPRCLR